MSYQKEHGKGNLLTLTKPLAQLSVCRGFTISAAHNPGFPGRLAPGEGLLVLGCSSVARLAEKDELCDDKLTPRAAPDQPIPQKQ